MQPYILELADVQVSPGAFPLTQPSFYVARCACGCCNDSEACGFKAVVDFGLSYITETIDEIGSC